MARSRPYRCRFFVIPGSFLYFPESGISATAKNTAYHEAGEEDSATSTQFCTGADSRSINTRTSAGLTLIAAATLANYQEALSGKALRGKLSFLGCLFTLKSIHISKQNLFLLFRGNLAKLLSVKRCKGVY